MENNCQKIKLVKLMEILQHDTDEEHPLTTNELCDRLIDMGISCERRTLSRDVSLLNEWGYEVMSMNLGHEKAYYIEDRSFSIPELKILIDAVEAASFITERKTEILSDKIADLAGSYRGQVLKKGTVRYNSRKHSNEAVYYIVSELEEAIHSGHQISFFYFDLDEKGNRIYRKEKQRYTAEPLALAHQEDNYYLISYSSKYKSTTAYRIDRMDSVAEERALISKEASELLKTSKISDLIEQAFRLYGGETCTVRLRFKDHLIGAVYDRFGENIRMNRLENSDLIEVSAAVQISPVFFGWLFQFAGSMVVVSPVSVREAYQKQLDLGKTIELL